MYRQAAFETRGSNDAASSYRAYKYTRILLHISHLRRTQRPLLGG